jgi:hypothetical protein
MAAYITKPNEKDFREWLRSISFVDKTGKVLPIELKEDTSPDPEGDREEKS